MQISNVVVIAVIACVAVLIPLIVFIIWMVLHKSKTSRDARRQVEKNLTIDIDKLPVRPPAEFQHSLSVYGVPGRLAVLVLAPLGRGSELPDGPRLRDVVNSILPDFTVVLDEHQPVFRRWEEQLSAHGFVHSFFTNLALPGNHGKGSVWCSIAGKVMTDDGHCLVGMVICCERPNQMSEINIEREGQWHDVIRVERTRSESKHN